MGEPAETMTKAPRCLLSPIVLVSSPMPLSVILVMAMLGFTACDGDDGTTPTAAIVPDAGCAARADGVCCPSTAGAPCCDAPEVQCPAGTRYSVATWDNGEVASQLCMQGQATVGPFALYDDQGRLSRFGLWDSDHIYCDPSSPWATWRARVEIRGNRPMIVCIEGCWTPQGAPTDCDAFYSSASRCEALE